MKLPARRRSAVVKELGKMEWERCAQDPKYWMDPKAHWVPYVYTTDPHPYYECKMCKA